MLDQTQVRVNTLIVNGLCSQEQQALSNEAVFLNRMLNKVKDAFM